MNVQTNARNFLVATLATLYTTATLAVLSASAPAEAQNKVYYSAELAQTALEKRAAARNVSWFCQGTTCVAARGTSRPARVCRDLQRKVGEITAFRVEGEAIDAATLEKCNK